MDLTRLRNMRSVTLLGCARSPGESIARAVEWPLREMKRTSENAPDRKGLRIALFPEDVQQRIWKTVFEKVLADIPASPPVREALARLKGRNVGRVHRFTHQYAPADQEDETPPQFLQCGCWLQVGYGGSSFSDDTAVLLAHSRSGHIATIYRQFLAPDLYHLSTCRLQDLVKHCDFTKSGYETVCAEFYPIIQEDGFTVQEHHACWSEEAVIREAMAEVLKRADP